MADILQVNWRYAPGPVEGRTDSNKYKLRGSKGKMAEGEEEREGGVACRRTGKGKQGGHKMSKYRRKTANARERMRMGEINTAFEKLKEKIPLPSVGLGRQKCEKLTKINLLHIAINYIRTLEDILETGEEDVNIFPEKLIVNPFQEPEEEMEEEEEEEQCSLLSGLKREESSSPDSGIQEDCEPECPDWTQLSSTLDLSQAPRRVSLPKTPLPPDAFKLLHLTDKVTKSKPVTLTSRSPTPSTAPLLPPTPLLLHCKSALFFPCSKEEEEEDLLPDLSGPFDTTFTGLAGIDFSYDDPFKVFS